MTRNIRSKGKEIGEIKCTKRFLPEYNRINNTLFSVVEKNPIQNEVDVFVRDTASVSAMKIQIVNADFQHAETLGINKHNFRGGEQQYNWIHSIKEKQEKYKRQGVDTGDIILFLDEMGDPPDVLFANFKLGYYCYGFKEIWLVRRYQPAIKLCKTYSWDGPIRL